VNTPGSTVPDDTYIPPGWDVDKISRNMYRHVYRPYCRTCHAAQNREMAFEKISDLDPEQVERAVCGGAMPNAEVPYGSESIATCGGDGLSCSRFGLGRGFWVDQVAKSDLTAYLQANGRNGCSQ